MNLFHLRLPRLFSQPIRRQLVFFIAISVLLVAAATSGDVGDTKNHRAGDPPPLEEKRAPRYRVSFRLSIEEIGFSSVANLDEGGELVIPDEGGEYGVSFRFHVRHPGSAKQDIRVYLLHAELLNDGDAQLVTEYRLYSVTRIKVGQPAMVELPDKSHDVEVNVLSIELDPKPRS